MPKLIFGAILLAIASGAISVSVVKAWNAKTPTFSERFAPVLKSTTS